MPLPPQVGDDELLANFVVESNKFKHDGIDHRQLMPSKTHGNTSAFRSDGLEQTEVADLGHNEVAAPRQKRGILGWAEFLARTIRAVTPLTLSSDEPPPRHAVIEGWPQQQEQRRALAMLLASKATVVMHSTVP